MRVFYHQFVQLLNEILRRYSIEVVPPVWEIPKDKSYGDLSTMIALKIASQLKCDPLDIARQIKAILEEKLGDELNRIEIVRPGFVNVFISRKGLTDSFNRILKQKDSFFAEKRKRRVLLEFVSANPTGPLSIAHGRQAVVGDVIARVLTFFGNEVCREYYVNDEGRQIELLVASVEARIRESMGQTVAFPEDGYKGEYVKEIAHEAQHVKRQQRRAFIIERMRERIGCDLSHLGIEFNSWFRQSALIAQGQVQKVIAQLARKALVYERDNASWFASSRFGDDKDRVLKKSDGELTYFSSDIAYHNNKIKRRFDKLINLWGPDHHGYIGRVRSAIKALGFGDEILDVIIIQLVSIKTKERMSRRKGTAIFLANLIEEVGPEAARFYYLLRRNSSPLEFDIDLAKSASFDNPLYYIQYAHARICSIFRKAGVENFSSSASKFLGDDELGVMRTILQFNYCLDKAYYTLEPVFIIEYLKQIATCFHQFYERKRVLSEDRNVTKARLGLLEALRVVLGCGLNLLGIKPLDKM